ncbi:unnamed protein product [Brassica napus]|uniref:peptidylprolyl isomerase n=1 Tax=Brassica napus TaxID=3708 RepID=A0A816WQD2_BRANA|nr:unnamed protein product [Brassica napus]
MDRGDCDKHSPKTCRNFVELSRRGYYDNVLCHRIIKDFIVQGGDPTGTGRGGQSILSVTQLQAHHLQYCVYCVQVKLAEVIGSFTTPRRMALFWSDKNDLLIEATTQIRTLLCGDCNVIALSNAIHVLFFFLW